MNLLMNNAPTCVKIEGHRIPINADYRTGIRFELLMMDTNTSPEAKLQKALGMYFKGKEMPLNLLEPAVNAMLWFYACGDEEMLEEIKGNSGKSQSRPHKRIYDYEYDADYIYAAFLQQYGYDLQKERPHWWVFKAMFKALTEETQFVKIMGYRSTEIDSNMSKSQKRFYQKMKQLHALPLPKDERQKLSAIEEALLNGGDLTGLR